MGKNFDWASPILTFELRWNKTGINRAVIIQSDQVVRVRKGSKAHKDSTTDLPNKAREENGKAREENGKRQRWIERFIFCSVRVKSRQIGGPANDNLTIRLKDEIADVT